MHGRGNGAEVRALSTTISGIILASLNKSERNNRSGEAQHDVLLNVIVEIGGIGSGQRY